ncbi:MAG TPA: hypothetical protein VFO40_12195, partial [Chthoniobacterales bacterium]|nr:hypothetical protein [Chthoniobacterales bacterium]
MNSIDQDRIEDIRVPGKTFLRSLRAAPARYRFHSRRNPQSVAPAASRTPRFRFETRQAFGLYESKSHFYSVVLERNCKTKGKKSV